MKRHYLTRQYVKRSMQAAIGAGLVLILAGGGARAQQKTPVQVPNPGVPQVMTLEGEFVRIAYNNEGYVTMGYRVANESVGNEWMLLGFGTTVRAGQQAYKLLRSSITLETPDGKKLPLPSNAEYLNADVRALEARAKTNPDEIGYFPPEASGQGCRVAFFAPTNSGIRVFDDQELVSNRACMGRLFFKIPGGIKYGQHWLNVPFKSSVVRVPFKIMTEAEVKVASKNWKDIKKQVDAAFKKGGGD
jgi:hypothetical protein